MAFQPFLQWTNKPTNKLEKTNRIKEKQEVQKDLSFKSTNHRREKIQKIKTVYALRLWPKGHMWPMVLSEWLFQDFNFLLKIYFYQREKKSLPISKAVAQVYYLL